jgi:hypothetical protein
MNIDEDKCVEHKLNVKQVASIARRLSKAGKEARALGLTIFGGSGNGSLRILGRGTSGIVADIDGNFDGGDGGDDY